MIDWDSTAERDEWERSQEEAAAPKKPVVKGPVNGNIFAVMAAAAKAMRHEGQGDRVDEMVSQVTESENYHQALGIVQRYVDFDL